MVHATERADARANRARLLAAAHAVFRERGLAAEMKEIAERAGIGVGTIYRNFPSKEALMLATLRDPLADAVAEVRAAEAMDDPIAALRALLTHELAMAGHYGWLIEALRGGQLPPMCRAQIHNELDEHHYPRRFERLVRRAVHRGRLRADLDVAAAAAMLAGAGTPRTSRDLFGDRTPAQTADAILASFLRGAAPDRPTP